MTRHLARRISGIGIALAAVGAIIGAAGPLAQPPPTARPIVLVELFTSEGCSSCPPADALLRRLVADQPVAGVDIVALGNHVDYWDRLGWRDPFSAALFSQRQSSYSARVFRSDSIYTPQVVVDGRFESVGTDEASIRRHLLTAAREPKAALDVSAVEEADTTVRITVRVQVPADVKRTGLADVVIAVTEDGLVTRVQRGENGGRTLAHSAVTRRMDTVAQVSASEQTASGSLRLTIEKDWTPSHLRLVAFVQEQSSRRVLGAAATTLDARRPRP